jgi:hypothetical protein
MCLHSFTAKREAPKHCSGLATVVEPRSLLNQVCSYLNTADAFSFTISRRVILLALVALADGYCVATHCTVRTAKLPQA